jgi:hypothetical protein
MLNDFERQRQAQEAGRRAGAKMLVNSVLGAMALLGANELLKSPGTEPTYYESDNSPDEDGKTIWVEVPPRGLFLRKNFLQV